MATSQLPVVEIDMTIETLRDCLLWSLVINYAVLFIWFFIFSFAKDWIRKLHGRWFNLSDATFDALHYGGMAIYKIGILLFNLTPFIALHLASNGA